MGNCTMGTVLDGNISVPQPFDEITTKTELNQIDKAEMATFQIPFETYVLTAFTNMIPEFLPASIVYKKQTFDQIVKMIKNIKNASYIDECFNIKNMINNVIDYLDENIKDSKVISQFDIKQLSKYKMLKLSKLNEGAQGKNIKTMFALDNKQGLRIKKNPYGNPNLVNSILFLQLKDNLWIKNLIYKLDFEYNIFVIKLFLQGLPRQIVLDEYIPFNEANEPAFLCPINNNYWIILVEKAIAKVNRSYANSLRCYASELFPLLTEVPLLKYGHSMLSSKALWKIIKEATQHNFICFSENHQSSPRNNLQIAFLSFFLSCIFKVNSTKYIELIIPEYGVDRNVLIDLKKTIHLEENDLANKKFFCDAKIASENILFMKFDNFHTFFNQTHILKKDNQYIHTSKKVGLSGSQYTMLKIKTTQKTKVIISIYFKESRFSAQEINHPLCRALLAQLVIEERFTKKSLNNNESGNFLNLNDDANENANVKDNNTILSESKGSFFEEENEYLWEYIDSVYGRDSRLSIESELDTGIYYLLVKAGTNIPIKSVISIYSSAFVEFSSDFDEEVEGKVIQPQNLTKLTTAVKSLLYSFLNKNKKISNIEGDTELHLIQSVNNHKCGLEIFKIENVSSSKLLTATFQYSSDSLMLIKHKVNGKIHETQCEISNNVKEFKVTLAPNSAELLIFENETVEIKDHTPTCIIEKPKHFDAKDFLTMKRTQLNDEVFYQEVPYGKGVLIVIVNQNESEYFLHTVFDQLDNLIIENSLNDKEIDMLLKPFSKNFINLLMMENDTVSYQMSFTIKHADNIGR